MVNDQVRLVAVPQQPFNFSRRYACDRCRSHKLRCIRDPMSTDSPCQRCRKAREICTIGSSIRPASAQARLNRLSLDNKLPSTISSSASPTALAPPPPPPQTGDAGLGENSQHDAMQLSSVPWLDIFDAGALDSTCESTLDIDFGGAAGTQATDSHDTVQGTTSPAHGFLTVPNDFDFSPSFDISIDYSTTHFRKDPRPQQDNTTDASFNRTNSPLNTPADGQPQTIPLDFITRPSKPTNTTHLTSSHCTNSTTSGNESGQTAAERRGTCIQELTNLSSSLMKDLHRVISCKMASSFLFTRSDKDPAECLFKTLDGSISEESAIGRILKGSEKFLEIMQLFNELNRPAPPFLDNSMRTESLELNLGDCFDSSEDGNQAQLERRLRIVQSYLDCKNATPSVPSFGSWLGDNFTNGACQKMGITSKLAVLTCYTCLLRIFEVVFFVIHHTLECSPSLAPAIKLPQTVPGLEINGFMLQNHPTLQIRILIQVSTYMLDSIEKVLNGMLIDPTFQALLKTVLQQEGLQCSPGNETGEFHQSSNIAKAAANLAWDLGMGSVRHLMGKVNKMLS